MKVKKKKGRNCGERHSRWMCPRCIHSVPRGWSQKTLVEKISGVWHPEQRTGWEQTDCKAAAKFYWKWKQKVHSMRGRWSELWARWSKSSTWSSRAYTLAVDFWKE
jgi:nitrate/TMAO reductase-like tetraheme cytochrome c subunit